MRTWKNNLDESKKRYIDWWSGKGIILNMWEHLEKDGAPHAVIPCPQDAVDLNQYWFDPQWRAENIDYQLSRSSFKADIMPIANTQLGPGSLAAILGSELEGRKDTIWIKHTEGAQPQFDKYRDNPYWKLHLDLLKECKSRSKGNYFVGCPDLMEGLDIVAAIKGPSDALMDIILQPDELKEQLQRINDIYFEVFDQIYDIIEEGGEMAFCYFSIWAPGKLTKLQCDISTMISEDDFRSFVQPYLREQAQRIDYTLYHLDGVGAIRHLDALLEIEELNAIQWTPGYGEPQGGDARWYELYKRILAGGKSVMINWVTLDELEPLIDNIGTEGLHINVDFKCEKDIDKALSIIEKYR